MCTFGIFVFLLIGGAQLLFWISSASQTENPKKWTVGYGSSAGMKDNIPLKDKIAGWVVYQRPDGIYKTRVDKRQSQRLVENGTYPRWSPDGKMIAFLRGRAIMVMTSEGGRPQEIAAVDRPRAVCFHPDGRRVLFTDGKIIRSVRLSDRKVQTVLRGYDFRELDISADGTNLVATVKTATGYYVKTFELDAKRSRTVSRGCSASISPDGKYVTVNGDKHKRLNLYQWDSLRLTGYVNAPEHNRFDNQYWSNHPDWLVSTSEIKGNDIYIHQISTNRTYGITAYGDCDRGDLFVTP